MRLRIPAGLLVSTLAFACPIAAQDDFQREGPRAAKDALEGKAPPALDVSGWIHAKRLGTKGAPTLAALKGKVVLLKFWGVW